MKSAVFIFCLSMLASVAMAQEKIPATDSFMVSGQIKNSITYTIESLDAMPKISLRDVVTVNHRGEALSTLHDVKGVLLKDVLKAVELNTSGPKQAFSYYMLCIASDGFKVVFSRDEIFNTMNGDNTYVVTESGGKKLKDINDRIAILMILGPGKGHVYIKGLRKIVFRSVEE